MAHTPSMSAPHAPHTADAAPTRAATRARRIDRPANETRDANNIKAPASPGPGRDVPAGTPTHDRTPAQASAGTTAASSTEATIDRIRARIAADLGPDRVARYFDGAARIGLTRTGAETTRLDITAPSHFIADMLSRKFGDALRRAAAAETASTVDLRFRVDTPAAPAAGSTTTASGTATDAPDRPAPAKRTRPRAGRRFRFDDFVVGEANKLAFAAAKALANEPETAETLTPLFIHASWGLGKTHLLQAIAAEARKPGVRVRYTTAEAFTNGFVAALRNNTLDAFRESYRALDVLCIDDIHFVAGKKQTQSELLHTLDAISMTGARIALASDGHPRDIRDLAQALSSRFLAGMVVRIDPPDESLRVQLVLSIARRQALDLDRDAASVIADRVARFPAGRSGSAGGSVRDIEGMLAQVRAVAQLLPDLADAGGRIGADLVRRALGLSDAPAAQTPRKPIALETITAEVCRYLRVDMAELLGRGRHKRVVLAREMVTYLARTMTTRSYPEIARVLGRPNHSTVITAFNRTTKQLAETHRIDINSEFDGITTAELAERLHAAVQRAHVG